MHTRDPITIAVTESSQVGEARRLGSGMAEAMGFDATSVGEIAIVLTEIATNLVRHAKSGEIIVRSLPPVACCGMEILALDRGVGLPAGALRDGFTTGRTLGQGLGAVGRLATSMDYFSVPGHGTAMLARFRMADRVPPHPDVGWVSLPKRGESANGDACEVLRDGGRTVIMIADGLGHGMHAAEASRRAVQVLRENPSADGPQLLDLCHGALRSTRGAAVSVAEIHGGQNELRFTGVGNVAARIVTADGQQRGLIGHNGTVGAEMRRVHEMAYPWSDASLLVMHSDGLGSQWQLSNYRGLFAKPPTLVAGVLYRDFRRERDDVTVLGLSGRGAA